MNPKFIFTKLCFTVFLAISINFCGLAWAKNSYAEESQSPDSSISSYKFMVAGHVYGSPTRGEVLNPAFSAVLDRGSLQEFKFVVLAGDFINSGTKENRVALEKELKKYPVPFYFVTGNHEKSWDEEGRWNRKKYLKWIGKDNTHYSFFMGQIYL